MHVIADAFVLDRFAKASDDGRGGFFPGSLSACLSVSPSTCKLPVGYSKRLHETYPGDPLQTMPL